MIPTAKGTVHGGDLAWASQQFGEPAAGWQDLSTGISPWGYPVAELPPHIWQRLPDSGEELRRAAAHYYRVPQAQLLSLPGSQFAIGRLPFCLPPARVALPQLGYAEHTRAWRDAGHQVLQYRDSKQLLAWVETEAVEHLVVINPNNPSAGVFAPDWLLALHRRHGQRGVLLIDETFVDVRPELSVAPQVKAHPDLWVLRSVGKFFGLAGMRLGFLLGHSERHPIHSTLEAELSPWGVSHPAQWLGAQALADTPWQGQQRQRIDQGSQSLEALWQGFLKRYSELTGQAFRLDSAGLFITLRGPWRPLARLYRLLAEQGVLLRWCHWPEPEHEAADSGNAWLRCGLPADSGRRLQGALDNILDREHNGQ